MSSATNSSVELVTKFQRGKRISSVSIINSDQDAVEPLHQPLLQFNSRQHEEKPTTRRKEPHRIDLSTNVIDGKIFEEAHQSLEKKKKVKKKRHFKETTLDSLVQSTPFSIVDYIDQKRNKNPATNNESLVKDKKKAKKKKKKKMHTTDSPSKLSSLGKQPSIQSMNFKKHEPTMKSINIDLMKKMGSKTKPTIHVNENDLEGIKDHLNAIISSRSRKNLHAEEYSILGKIMELKYNI